MLWWRWLRERSGSTWLLVVIALALSSARPGHPGSPRVAPLTVGAVGACCLIDQSCMEISEADCSSIPYGGVYQGDGTLCSAVECPEVTDEGSCCFSFGFCGCCMSEAVCLLGGGVYYGPVLCDDIECPAQAACCLPDGSCTITEQPECESAGGVFMGIAALCSEVECTGACCVLNFECNPTTEQECLSMGGDYHGDGTVCIFEPCVTFGACCLPNGLCEITTETQCVVELSGSFWANFTCFVASNEILIADVESWDLEGDPDNYEFFVPVAIDAGYPPGTPIRLTGISWDLALETYCPGWWDDARIGLGDNAGDNTIVLTPGAGDQGCGIRTYSGGQQIDLILTDGTLALEFFESYDDLPNQADAIYLLGSTLTYVYEHPCETARVENITKSTWHPTIGEAIDLADPNDDLMVSPGVYYELVDLDKRVTVQGLSGDPGDVVIDGGHIGTVVTISQNATLRNVTVTNADAPEGGPGGPGSGILVVAGSSPLIDNCVILSNSGINGGGIRVEEEATPTIYRTLFADNNAYQRGGGLYVREGASATVLASTFEFNGAVFGGGVYVDADSTAVLKRIVFRRNTADVDGSAVATMNGEARLSSCLVHANTAGAVPANASIGAALYNRLGEMHVINCTVTHNIGDVGSALNSDEGATLMVNSIFWGNHPRPDQIIINEGLAEMRNCAVQVAPLPNIDGIDGDPMFIDPPHDYRLNLGSPCVNTGAMDFEDVCLPGCVSPAVYPPLECYDLDENERIRTCRVDVGAYESPFFVDCNDNGLADACDVSPVYGFLCTVMLDLGDLPGSAMAFTIDPNSLTIEGNNNSAAGPSVAWLGTTLPITGGTFRFYVSYSSDDIDCAVGSWDYPVLVVNGSYYGLNHDGTIKDSSALNCEAAGSIDNEHPLARGFEVSLEELVGTGPYDVGIGVVSVDNMGGAGTVTFSQFRAVDDGNGNGVPDGCDCPWDVDGDDEAAFSDVLEIILNWGPCPVVGPCRLDVNENGVIDFADILEVILNWGECFPAP